MVCIADVSAVANSKVAKILKRRWCVSLIGRTETNPNPKPRPENHIGAAYLQKKSGLIRAKVRRLLNIFSGIEPHDSWV